MKTFEIVRFGAKRSESFLQSPPNILALIWPLFGNFLVIFCPPPQDAYLARVK